jgi:hypothetical protein
VAIGDLRIGLGCEAQPTEIPMTEDNMDVQALLGKSADADFLREMIGFAAQRLMGRQASLCSSTPTDLPPLCLLEHGMGGPGFYVGDMPNPRSSTPRHRKDQLHVGWINLLMAGDADGPA